MFTTEVGAEDLMQLLKNYSRQSGTRMKAAAAVAHGESIQSISHMLFNCAKRREVKSYIWLIRSQSNSCLHHSSLMYLWSRPAPLLGNYVGTM